MLQRGVSREGRVSRVRVRVRVKGANLWLIWDDWKLKWWGEWSSCNAIGREQIFTELYWTACFQNNKRFSELAPHRGGKTAGIDVVWRNYVTVTLCILVITLSPPPVVVRSIAMSVCVCLSVCLSARISQKWHIQTSQNFLYMLAYLYGRGSVVLWQQCRNSVSK